MALNDNSNPPIDGQVVEVAREARSSIELDRDSKGTYRWAIKIYFDAQEDDETGVIQQIRRVDQTLRSMFNPDPLPY